MKKIGLWIVGIIVIMYFGFGTFISYLDIKTTLGEYGENEMIKYYGCGGTKTEQAWCLFKQGGIKTISLAGACVIWGNLKPIIIEYFGRMKITEPEDKNDCEITNECISEPDLDFLEGKCTEYVNKSLFDNIEGTPSPGKLYFYENSGSMEYVFLDAKYIGPYYGIVLYVKAGDVVQNFLCNVFPNGGLHDLHFYNKSDYDTEDISQLHKELESMEMTEVISEQTSELDEYVAGFTGNIINGSHRETFIITGDNTLYYNDEFGFAIKLGKERNGAKIEIGKWCEECTETEYPHHIMINLLKPKVKKDWPMDWYSTISFSVVTKLEYEKMLELTKGDPMCEGDCIKDNTIGHNNHYYFLLGYTNQAPEDIINLFQGQLECDLIYPKGEEWTSSELPWDCTYALKKISSNYHFYNIMSDVPTILDD